MSTKAKSHKNSKKHEQLEALDDPSFDNNTLIDGHNHIDPNQYKDEDYDEVVYYDRPSTDNKGIVRYKRRKSLDRDIDQQLLEKLQKFDKYEEMLYRMNYYLNQNNRPAIKTHQPGRNKPRINIESNRTQSNIKIYSGYYNDTSANNDPRQIGDGSEMPQINIKIDQGGDLHVFYFSLLAIIIFI